MNRSVPIRIIKYGLTLLGLTWILFITDLSYALVSDFPNCSKALEMIVHNIQRLFFTFYIPLLIVCTGLNYLIEKFIEKKAKPKEYLVLFIIQFLVILLICYSISHLYYHELCQ
jgi:hypothetical protein